MSLSSQEIPLVNRKWTSILLGTLPLVVAVGCTQPSPSPAKTRTASMGFSPKRDWRAEEFRKMVALGESTTAGGWSTSPDRCWAPTLAGLINDFQATPMELFNAGIGANVISTQSPSYERSGKPAALERIDQHVIAQNPDLLIISYGLNDARGGTPIELFSEELTHLVRRVREEIQPLIVLLGPYYMTAFERHGPSWNQADLERFYSYNRETAKVAEREGCLFVDLLAAYGEAEWMIHYDGVHANDLGHRIVANRIFEVLAQNCSGLAKKTKEAEKKSPRWRDESVLRADYGY